MSLPALWPHQPRAIDQIAAHIASGTRRIILNSPTGGGKSRIVYELIMKYLSERGWKSVVYTNRKMLVSQLVKGMTAAGIDVGIRAAKHPERPDCPVQVSSIQTEDSRVYKRKGFLKWELFPAQLVFIDEAHLQSGAKDGSVAERIKSDHYAAGAVIIEVTATPLDMDGKAQVIVTAGVNSELRQCGALVPALHYGPDEPDLRHIGLSEFTKTKDLTEPQCRRLMGQVRQTVVEGEEPGEPKANVKLQRLFGRVLEWYNILNPERRPGILFAPGVAESRWFAQQFEESGISAAHIDGNEIWTASSGDLAAEQGTRDELLEMSRDGSIKLLCNRFVLREGIDCPWLAHGIFATCFGSLQSYLQSGGRLLRASTGLDRVTVQDHGGNWWKHGSLNADRDWPLGASSRIMAGQREEGLREKREREPSRCPKCAAIMMSLRCVCGFTLDPRAKTRPVVMENGSLIMMEGDIFRPRVTERRPDTQGLWMKEYWRARNGKMTFRQASAMFYQQHGYWPPTDLPSMPKEPGDTWRLVAEVPKGNLHV